MTIFLLVLSLAVTTYLSIYGLIFIFLAISIWFVKKEKPTKSIENYGDISILVPAHNEGEAILDTLNTVEKQDYSGIVEIVIIVNDKNDNVVLPLLKKFSKAIKNDDSIELFSNSNRKATISFSNFQNKRDKLNFFVPKIQTKYAGILDADHRVESNWVSSSLQKMEVEKTNAVQSRRKPLAVSSLFQIWDSIQNHIGNEIVNSVLNKIFHSVFFTGTTCIFKTNLLKKHQFAETLTEDTYLSYDFELDNEKVSYNSISSSYEEVAPDTKNYIARRRRWSAGHNKTFFDHFLKILKSNLLLRKKTELFFHGQFFFVPILVLILLNTYGIYYVLQYTSNVVWGILLISVFLSLSITVYFKKKKNNLIADFIVAFIWIFPQISILGNWLYKTLGSEIYYFILVFPLSKALFPLYISLIFAPLLTIASGIAYFKQKNLKNILLLPTYPIFMFLDIYSCLLGFTDYVLGKSNWTEIKRKNLVSEEIVPEDLKKSIGTGKRIKTNYKKTFWFVGAVLVIFLANDLLAFDNCGKIKKFLWKPLLIKPSSTTKIDFDIERKIINTDSLEVKILNSYEVGEKTNIETYLDDKIISKSTIEDKGVASSSLSLPLGWEKHKISLKVENKNVSCEQIKYFSTSLKEIRDDSLFINGEKFLIKGIVPSFSGKLTGLTMDEGLKQIKETGANTVRFYHSANDELRYLAEKNNLLIINQPDNSTWDEFNIDGYLSKKSYHSKYNKMLRGNEGSPFVLINGLGNEWELGKDSNTEMVPKINSFIKQALASSSPEISSYSTYFTYANYPVDVNGINMLDTGKTYWEKALKILKDNDKPFYASEFGGFVAFWEVLPTNVRISRINDYWQKLLDAGALGAVFFESHDNWAQPVVNGYNDPFKAEQPDDTRGLWDKDNKEKNELESLKEIYSDLEIKAEDKVISNSDKEIKLKIKNIRPYNIKNLSLFIEKTEIIIGDLNAGESKDVSLPVTSEILSNPKINISSKYTTHSGFKQQSVNKIALPINTKKPIILNNDFVEDKFSATDDTKGKLIYSNKISFTIPNSWKKFEFNGDTFNNQTKVFNFNVENPYLEVKDLKYSTDGKSWNTFDSKKITGGVYYLKFELPENMNSEKYLILSGLGASEIGIDYGDGNFRKNTSFNYRENLIDLSKLDEKILKNEITIKILRDKIGYISAKNSPTKNDINIDLEAPKVFSPLDIRIRKIQ